MDFPCNKPASLCDQLTNPATGYSSEGTDSTTFIALAWAPEPPLLNKPFNVYACEGIADSQVSQDDATLAAMRQAVICSNPCSPLFPNTDQIAQASCPDGSAYFYTAAAGLFLATSQLAANRQALSYATGKLRSHSICLGSIPAAVMCQGSFYSSEIVMDGPDKPFVVELSSGTLPGGIGMTVEPSAIFFSGTPTALGEFNFSIKVTTTAGTYTEKAYSLTVVSITTPSTLPDGFYNTSYTQPLLLPNPTTESVDWSVVSGSLPPGLILNPSTGVISGTPSLAGQYQFTVHAAIGSAVCSQTFSLRVQGINWANVVWSLIKTQVGGGAGGVGSGTYNGGVFAVAGNGNGSPAGLSEALGTIHYTGPAVSCRVTVTVTSASANFMGFAILQDGIGKLTVTQATLSAPGTYVFNFTVASTAGSTITIKGSTDIGDPTPLFVWSFNSQTSAFSATISNV